MKYPKRNEVYKLISNPDYYAEQMSVPEIDHVVFGFMTIRHYKER